LGKEQLASAASIAVGTVKAIYTEETKDARWIKIAGVVEIQVGKLEKGDKIEAGDLVYVRFWQEHWIGKGNPPPYGSGHGLPKKGDKVRVYLDKKDGGYEALLPNGFEVITGTRTPADDQPAAPSRNTAPTKDKAQSSSPSAADQAAPRTDPNSKLAHEQMLEALKKGRIDVYFVGDSITRRWRATDYPQFLANWNENFFGWNAANFGWGGDTIQNILWRMQHGELEGVDPRLIVLLAGTNNVGNTPASDAKVSEIVRGIQALLDTLREKAPKATIVVMGILPRNDSADPTAVMRSINTINERIAKFADGETIRYLNINDKLADSDGKLFDGMTGDRLHLSLKGYQVWADALKPLFTELIGPAGQEDHAPPPTGDPSAAGKKAR
jgi:lysophospholipase L1-like esterase